jgi:hypothetical protein
MFVQRTCKHLLFIYINPLQEYQLDTTPVLMGMPNIYISLYSLVSAVMNGDAASRQVLVSKTQAGYGERPDM